MAPLSDPIRLQAYKDALGNWNFAGYIQFALSEQAHNFVRQELDGITLKELGRLMHEWVAEGGVVDEVRETRPEWLDQHEFHHDLRLTIQSKAVYIETRLHYRLPLKDDESWILVVNVHAP